MNTDEFWAIIDQSLADSDGGVEDQTEQLRRLLDDIPDEDLVAFDTAFVTANRRLYSWPSWGAMTVMLGGCGDDTVTDFRSWVISRGRQVYERFLEDPDTIVDAGLDDDDEIGLAEGFAYVAAEVLEQRPDNAIRDSLPEREDLEPDDEPAGERVDNRESALAAIYPRLAARYMGDSVTVDGVQGPQLRLPSIPRHPSMPRLKEEPSSILKEARPWIIIGPFFDIKVSWGSQYGQKMWWLCERVGSDPEWNNWWATSGREKLELRPYYTRSGKEEVRVTVNAARVSVQPLFLASRFQNVGPERLTEQAAEDFESMIEAARSRLKLAAPPKLPTSRRKAKRAQKDLP